MTQQEFTERYQFSIKTDKIGGGSFGTVYRAYDTILDREVAIKISEVKFVGDKEFSLLEEYKAIENISAHKCIANYEEVFRFESFNGIYDYGLMQYYPLGNLSSYLKNNEVSLAKRESITKDILEGIAFLHQYKVVHRDLKPSNILVVNRRGEIIPKITDFGLSKQAEGDGKASRFTNSFAGGTLQYSSPEQLKGLPLKLNTDLWSFGVIAYEILTGNTLFEANKQSTASAELQNQITQKILHADVSEQLKALPTNWQQVVKSCLERDLSKRVQNADALFAILHSETSPQNIYEVFGGIYKNINLKESIKSEENIEQTTVNNDQTIITSDKKEQPKAETATKTNNSEKSQLKEPKTPSTTNQKSASKSPMTTVVVVIALLLSSILYFVFKTNSETSTALKLQLFENDGFYGYKLGDSIAIAAQFKIAREFRNGIANVETKDSSFYIDTKGEWILNPTISNKETINPQKKESTKKKEIVKPLKKEDTQQIIIDSKLIPKEELSSWIQKGDNLKNTLTAANIGNVIAQRRLGRINHFVYNNKVEAVKWYRKSAEQGDIIAQYNLGSYYETGQGVDKDEVEAFKWFKKAAVQEDAPAQYKLGDMYLQGVGVLKSQVEAFKWYLKAAEQGYANAQNSLAFKFKNGIGVSKDESEAVKWFRKAAEQGYASAQNNLGSMYQNGSGVTKNGLEAAKWYLKAAEQNDINAQVNLASMYEYGNGIPIDYVKAVQWYRILAEKKVNNNNDFLAAYQAKLGHMYENGKGVTKDYNEAVKWYRKAAENGNANGQMNYGYMYEKGLGINKNINEAIKWYQKAAAQGDDYAKKALQRLGY